MLSIILKFGDSSLFPTKLTVLKSRLDRVVHGLSDACQETTGNGSSCDQASAEQLVSNTGIHSLADASAVSYEIAAQTYLYGSDLSAVLAASLL